MKLTGVIRCLSKFVKFGLLTYDAGNRTASLKSSEWFKELQEEEIILKTIIFNGSPRRGGDTEVMIQEMQKHLDGEVLTIRAYDHGIEGCVDCRYCWTHPRCAFADWQDVDRAIREADNIIIASPIYFGEVTGAVLNAMSKIQVYWSAKFLRQEELIEKPKKGGVILAYAGNCDINHPLKTLQIYLRNMRVVSLFDPVLSGNTDKVPARQDEHCLEQARNFARFLNQPLVPGE